MTSVTEAASPPASRPLGVSAVLLMTMLCLSWGFNQVAVKLALPDIPPMTQAALRSFGALFVILAGARFRGVDIYRRDGTLKVGVGLGALFALEFVAIYTGLVWTTATRAVVFLYTAPFFVALGARTFLGERLSGLQWAGLALSFLGIVVAVGVPQPDVDARVLFGDCLIITGAAFWAATTLLFKASALAKAPAEKAMAYQLAVSAPILAVFAVLFGERFTGMPGTVALASLAYQTIWVVGITFLIWYALMKTYSASKLSSFSFITPLFGVAAGHFVLGEPISPGFVAAAAFVIAGLVLVNRRAS
jgi:drug/metabolite transporter (DMT)-like permease